MKNIFDIMDDTDKSVQEFSAACKRLCTEKFILAERAVSDLLRTIAGGRVLYDLIKICTDGFDFSVFLRKVKREINGRSLIKIDNQPRKTQIAFVFCLLYSFDLKKTDMQKFIHTYYSGASINEEFASFCAALIEPFSKNILSELAGEEDDFIRQMGRKRDKKEARNSVQLFKDNGSLSESLSKDLLDEFSELSSKELDVYREKIDHKFAGDDGDDRYLDDLQAQSLSAICREIISVTALAQSLNPLEREEILIICEAFEKALDFGGVGSVKIMYIALKNTLRVSSIARSLNTQIESLTTLGTEYGL